MIQPSQEQLELLSWKERLLFRLASFFAGPLRWVSPLICYTFGVFVVLCGTSRRVKAVGLENVRGEGADTRILMVANHRSFFDFYAIGTVVAQQAGIRARLFFPVRSNFFYDSFFGAFVNFVLTGMAMFPPVMREKSKAPFNRYALARMQAEIQIPGTILGIHPEGKRGLGPDPYTFLPAQAGPGAIALTVDGVRVLPVFILGFSNNMLREIWLNLTNPSAHPIYIYYGNHVELDDLRPRTEEYAVQKQASERLMSAIGDLANEHKRRHDPGALNRPAA